MKHRVCILVWLLLMIVSAGILSAEIPPPTADFTGEGAVDLADFAIFASSWETALAWFADGGLPPQTIAQWSLDQNGLDSVSAFDGVAAGSPVWYARNSDPDEVKIGSGALGLSGQDCLVVDANDFPDFPHSFTVEAWIKTSYTQQEQTVISKGDAWRLGIEAGTGTVFFACAGLSGTPYLAGNTKSADGAWHHVAGIYDAENATAAIYLDGMLDAQGPASGQAVQNELEIRIGADPRTGGSGWHGTLDNIIIYNYVPSCEQLFTRTTYHVDVKSGMDEPPAPDPEWGKGRSKAFSTIQHAIDVAADGDTILVWPGMYQESIFFMGKAVTVRSAADAAILQADPSDGIAVTFMYGEQSGSVLENVIILNSDIALYVHQSSPTLKHLTVVNNQYGMDCIFNAQPQVRHCIFWQNSVEDVIYDTYAPPVTYSCIQRPYPGQGNIASDPLFVNPDGSDPNTMDFHLQSEFGRYLPDGQSEQRPKAENWVTDRHTSPCIDAGDPQINPFHETMCNGGIVNLGAYGSTPFAGKSGWVLPADMDYSGQVGVEDILLFAEQWFVNGP